MHARFATHCGLLLYAWDVHTIIRCQFCLSVESVYCPPRLCMVASPKPPTVGGYLVVSVEVVVDSTTNNSNMSLHKNCILFYSPRTNAEPLAAA